MRKEVMGILLPKPFAVICQAALCLITAAYTRTMRKAWCELPHASILLLQSEGLGWAGCFPLLAGEQQRRQTEQPGIAVCAHSRLGSIRSYPALTATSPPLKTLKPWSQIRMKAVLLASEDKTTSANSLKCNGIPQSYLKQNKWNIMSFFL